MLIIGILDFFSFFCLFVFPCGVACVCVCVCVYIVAQLCLTLCGPMDYIACQATLPMENFKQEYWSGLLFPAYKLNKQVAIYSLDVLFSQFGTSLLFHVWF